MAGRVKKDTITGSYCLTGLAFALPFMHHKFQLVGSFVDTQFCGGQNSGVGILERGRGGRYILGEV